MNPPAWPPPVRRRLWLMRHGSVAYFGPGSTTSFGDAVLTEQGCHQADAAREFLSSRSIDLVITSGLPRAMQTASRVRPGQQATTDTRWREIEPGQWPAAAASGLNDKLQLTHALKTLGPGLTRDSQFMGGETFGSLEDRVGAALKSLLEDTSWTEALLVAHSVALRCTLARCLGGNLDTICRIEQDAGCLNLVEFDPAGWPLVRLVNHTPPDAVKLYMRMSSLEELLAQALKHGSA
ncbi:MAG: histidine phosphatase family protein [Gemmataceae bacterium]